MSRIQTGNRMRVKKQNQIHTAVPFVAEKNEILKIDNKYNFSKIMIVHNSGTLDVGNVLPNNIFKTLVLNIRGKPAINLIGDYDAKKEPYMIQLNKQLNKLANRVGDSDGFIVLRMPDLIKQGHNAYLEATFNTIANISDGAGTTYTGATIDVIIESEDRIPTRDLLPLRNGGKEPFGTKTGEALRFFVNPTESGYIAKTLIGIIEDDGTPSNTVIKKIALKKGSDTIKEGSIAKLQELTKLKYQQAMDTGFFLIEINQPIGASELVIEASIDAGATDIDLHWLLNSIKAI